MSWGDTFKDVSNWVQDTASDAVDTMNDVVDAVSDAVSDVVDAVSDAYNKVKEWFNKEIVEKIKEFCKKKYYKVINVTISVNLLDTTDNKFMMNDPDRNVEVEAVMEYTITTDPKDLESLPEHIFFSFTDPASDNTEKANSYGYSGSKFLGKKNDATAKYWKSHPECSASSDDAFKTKAKVTTKTLEVNKKEFSKVYFKPSGVGGNDYKLTATVYKPDETTVLATDDSNIYVVWRKVSFDNIYEMKTLTHVSTNATTAIISPVYTPAFVEYSAGTRNEMTTTQTVKYIGLWKDSSTTQRSWATIQAKKAAETPTADEITEATYTGTDAASLTKRVAARQAINDKAQVWADRIDSAFSRDMRKWVSDVALPANTLAGIQYYHPKFSSRGGDFATNEWKLGGASVPNWLRVGAFQKSGGGHYYTNLDPDGLWVNWGGLSHGNGIVSVPKGIPNATTKQVIRHEAGHATKSFFKRDVFGASLDHSVSNAGIMYYTTSGGTTFTTREKKILRGIKP